MPRARVVVVGSVNVDLVVSVPAIVGGGATITGADFRREAGGKGANQASAAARLGVPTRLVACIGADGFGRDALAALADGGVGLEHVATEGPTTGVALVQVDDAGENAIVVVPGANASLTPEHVDRAFATLDEEDRDDDDDDDDHRDDGGSSTVVVLGLETPMPTAVHAADAARSRGWRVILNPAPAQPLPVELVGALDVLVPNQHEVDALGFASVDEMLAAGARAVVVTYGADGSSIHRPGEEAAAVAAHRVDARDTTGAGDAFIGALAAALARGSSLDGAVAEASVAGALATRGLGARASLATRAEIDAARG